MDTNYIMNRMHDRHDIIHHVHVKSLPEPLHIIAKYNPIDTVCCPYIQDGTSGRGYRCPVCGEIIRGTMARVNHQKNSNLINYVEFSCSGCGTSFITDPGIYETHRNAANWIDVEDLCRYAQFVDSKSELKCKPNIFGAGSTIRNVIGVSLCIVFIALSIISLAMSIGRGLLLAIIAAVLFCAAVSSIIAIPRINRDDDSLLDLYWYTNEDKEEV